MRKIKLEERKKLQLEILLKVHEFCEQNNITYFLSSGTLIGAVRHKGYIPWDDDIDIAMPRPDYEKFMNIFKDENLIAKDYKRDKSWPYFLAKICDRRTLLIEKNVNYKDLGVNIDLFPIDGVSDNSLMREVIYRFMNFEVIIVWHRVTPIIGKVSVLRYIEKFISFLFPIKSIIKLRRKLIEKYSYESSKYVSSLSTTTERKTYKKEWFEEIIKLPFEGYMLNAPVGYHDWLRTVFGDYMTLPPVEERIIHNVEAYWKD